MYEDFCFKNERYRILSLYISLNSTNKIFRKGEETIDTEEAYERFKFIPNQYGLLTYYLLENGWTVNTLDSVEYQYRIIRNCINCNIEANLIERNGKNVFCGTKCQKEYYFKK